MNPSEDPNDRLIDSLLSEQAKGKPDEALLRAIASKLQAPPKPKSIRRNLDFFWPATAAAVVLLAAGGLLWSAFEKPDEKAGRLVEAPGPDPAEAGGELPVAAPGEEKIVVQGEEAPPVVEPNIAGAGDPKPVLDQESGEAMDDHVLALNALRYVRDESTMWYVQFGFESQGKWAPKLQALPVGGKLQTNKISAIEMIKPGDTFFKDGMMAGRFKFLGITERVIVSERTKMAQKVKFAEFEDLKPNKKGERYESQYGLPDAQLTASAYYDRTAVLAFQGNEFRVDERTTFRLPQGGDFHLKLMTPDRVVVELRDRGGKVITREIAR